MLRAVGLLLALAWSPLALADEAPATGDPSRPPDDPDVVKAREHFRLGQARFAAGDYVGALKDFETARLLKAVPEFEYNMGICHEHLGQEAEAIASFQSYLSTVFDPATITEVRARIARLQAVLTEKESRARCPPPPPPPAPRFAPASPPSYAAPIAVGVATLALAAIGVALVAPVSHEYGSISAAWDRQPTPQLAGQADYLKTRLEAGYALFAAAGVAAVIDIILWVRTGRERRDVAAAALAPSLPSRTGLAWLPVSR